MQAVILAGGLGTRLRPLTYTRPKALLPLLNKPMVVHIIRSLPRGVREIILASNYLTSMLKKYFEEVDVGRDISVVEERKPMGTAGAVKNLEEYLDNTFLVFNGDIITSLDVSAFLHFHKRKGGLGTIALKQVENPMAFGMVQLNEKGRIERFKEKPKKEEIFSNLINAGVYALHCDILSYIPKNKKVSIEKEIFPKILERGMYGYPFHGYWADAGTLKSFLEANSLLLERFGSSISKGASMRLESKIEDPVAIGEESSLIGGEIGPHVSIGNQCILEEVRISNSVLLNNVTASRAQIMDSILGQGVVVNEGAKLEDCIVADFYEIPKGVKWKGKRVGK